MLPLQGQDEVPVAGDAAVHHFEANDLALWAAACLHFKKRFSSKKIALVQFEPAIQASFEDVDVFRDFVSVEAHACFEAEGIACAETAGADAKLGAGVEECVPHLYRGGFVGGGVDLEAVFAAVAGAGDEDVVNARDLTPREPVIPDGGQIDL